MRKQFLVYGLLLVTSPLLAKDLATVDGQGVTEDALKRSVEDMGPRGDAMLANPVVRRQVLDKVIDTRLLAHEALQKGLDKDKQFQAQLAEQKTRLLANLYAKRYLDAHTTEKDLKAFFDKDPNRFSDKELKASHILVADEPTALKALEEARKPGANFDELAKKYNAGPSGPKGGSLGWFRRGRMIKEFEVAAFATPKGQVYDKPIHTQFGWHVLKVEDERGHDTVEYERVKPRVKEALEIETRNELLASLRRKAKVAVDESAVKDAKF